MQDLLNVEMTDEQIMDLLEEALQDITGFDEAITRETLLIDAKKSELPTLDSRCKISSIL